MEKLDRSPDRILIAHEDILTRTANLAEEIHSHFASAFNNLVLLGIMDGGMIFLAELLKHLPHDIIFETWKIKTYQGCQSSENLPDMSSYQGNFEGRAVVIIDDILDTGNTLHAIEARLLELGAVSVDFCVLLSKKVSRRWNIQPRWIGFEIPDEFVVGYGLDYEGHYRNLPDIRTLSNNTIPS